MKVIVLGSGVIGITTAYYLARAGHEVVVLDRQDGPALETSFANAGEVSPGYSAPWAGPGVPLKAIKWLLMRHRPLVIRPMLDPAMWRWGLAMLRNCTAARYGVNKGRMVRLAEYSRDCLTRTARARPASRYDERTQGTLQLFRTQKQLDGAAERHRDPASATACPTSCSTATAASRTSRRWRRCSEKFVGGLRLPGDETGDCYKFTSDWPSWPSGAASTFRFGIDDPRARRATARASPASRPTPAGARPIAYLVALGSYSPRAARAARHRHPGLSGQGLLDHAADRRCRAARPSRRSWTRRTRSR